MRALVTGASGFVGGHLCEHLVAAGDVVVGLSSTGAWPSELRQVGRTVRLERFHLVSGRELDLVDLLRRKQPEVIYHLAAQPNPSRSLETPRETWAMNLGGALNLLESVRHAALDISPRVILVGSGVCYGNPEPGQVPVREDCPLHPNNPYASSKAAADLLGVQYYLSYGIKTIIVRPFNHAGPRQAPTYVLPGLALQVAEAEAGLRSSIEVGNLDVVRDFTDVRDVVRGYRLLALHGEPGEIYNLGSGIGTKIADALDRLVALARCPVRIQVDPARVRPVDLPLLIADSTKLRNRTGWRPEFTIEQTLIDILDGFRGRRTPEPG